ncbi:hypothetical protein F2Q70_00017968 [Brassica cretica]|uniref:Uncharacterized protein n=1 Tax=Brassica cretica TaxID=69181 RepID=A0A8S9I743_BRACR|nr:hypothetical protein F2Q70_00017968 [Brassica cretica]KAF2598891.1 hypothetical protein F2Q68_00010947 [Brassica cretica]
MGRQQDRCKCVALSRVFNVSFRVSSFSFIVSRLQDPYGSSEIFASCCTISATSVTPSRARILAMCSGTLRPMPLIASHYVIDQNWVQHLSPSPFWFIGKPKRREMTVTWRCRDPREVGCHARHLDLTFDYAVEIELPEDGETPENVRPGYCGAYVSHFEDGGLSFPLPRFLLEVLAEIKMAFTQMAPNFFRYFLG